MASKVQIANRALRKVGGKRITSLSENSEEARVVNDMYDDTLKLVLAEGLWTFAQKRATLATVTGTPLEINDDVSVIYSKPSDFIRLNFVNDPTAIIKVEGEYILSDTASINILYTFFNENTEQYLPNFVDAFSTKLASDICFDITESVRKSEALIKQYEEIDLPKALASDAQQGTPIAPQQNQWEAARISGGNIFVGVQPNDETWHPVW